MNPSEGLEHELAFARAFIEPNKRNRYEQLLQSPKRRRDVVAQLDHFGDLDPRFTYQIPSNWAADRVYRELLQRGAPSTCYVMSLDLDLDGKELPLLEAVTQVYGSSTGTLLSCLPGRLAIFVLDEIGGRFLLER